MLQKMVQIRAVKLFSYQSLIIILMINYNHVKNYVLK